MFDTLKMIVYKFNEQKKEFRQNLKQFFCRHDYVKKEENSIFSFSSKYHLECSKCGSAVLLSHGQIIERKKHEMYSLLNRK